jgi:hypothetical protein
MKKSLITALKLLQADSNFDLEKSCQNETEAELGDETIQANPPSSDQPPNQPANKEKRHKKRKKCKRKKSKPNVPDLTAGHSADVPAAPSDVAVSAASETTVGSNRPDSTRHRKKTVVIAGDSIENIVGARMSGNDSNHYSIVKPFPGATISDMEDFVKPLSRRSPDKMILHVGTNDLRSCTPGVIADSIVNLVTQVKEDSPNTTIGVSAILVRNDNNDLAFKAL